MNSDNTTYQLVYEGHDAYGPIQILDHNNHRSMHFGTDAKQSETLLNDPYALTLDYTRLMAFSTIFCPSPKSILCLGLGGGSLPKFFWKHFPQCWIDVVERSPLVIELCYRYFALPNSKRLQVYEADAFAFLEQSALQYDLIFIDLYTSAGVSDIIARQGFFKGYRQKLNEEKSLLIFNLWKNSPEETVIEGAKQIGESFGRNVLILPNKEGTSYVFLLLTNDPKSYDRFQLVKQAQKLKKKTGIDFPQILADFNFLVL